MAITTPEIKLSDRRCLLVSADPELLKTFRGVSSTLDLTVATFERAEQIIHSPAAQSVDGAVIDVRTPDIDRLEVLHHFRSAEAVNKIPVLMITATDDQATVNKYVALGANACLSWPTTADSLSTALRYLLGQTQSGVAEKPADTLSVSSMGTWRRFVIAVFLISILPVLALSALVVNPDEGITLMETAPRAVLMIDIMFMVFGYGLLVTYPINVIRLRKYLEAMARGSMPEKVDLLKEENDLAAIESCMKTLVTQTQQRIKTVEVQTQALLQAERQRVMFESLGAACHHLGQPATVIDLYLAMIGKDITNPDTLEMISKCQESSKEIANILRKLQTMTQYQTEYYRPLNESDAPRPDERIIKI